MRFALAELPVSEGWAERRLQQPNSRNGDPGERAGLALPLTTAETQVLALTEALAWAGVALWGGGLAWLVASDMVARWSRRHPDRRDEREPGVRTYEDAS